MNAMRSGGSESFSPPVAAGAAEDIDSSHGSDIAAPMPRNSVLLEMGLNIDGFLRLAYHFRGDVC